MWWLSIGCPRTVSPPPATPPAATARTVDAEARSFYLRAQVAEAQGDLDEAERSIAWIVRLDRQDPWAWIRLSEFQLRRQRPQDAVASATQALALDPESPDARRALGLASLEAGDPVAAAAHLEGLVGVEGPSIRARAAAGDEQGARSAFDAWKPDSPSRALERADTALALGWAPAAERAASAWVDDPIVGPDAARRWFEAGQLGCDHRALYQWVAPKAWLLDDPRWAALLGEIAPALGADDLLEQVLERGHDRAAYAAWLTSSGNPASALQVLDTHDDDRATQERGRAELALGRVDDALATWAQLDDASSVALRADALLSLGRAEEALQITEGQTGPSARWVRAGALVVLGRIDEAVVAARDSASTPIDADLREAKLRALAGDRSTVAAAVDVALADDPCHVDALLLRAGPVSCASAGDFEAVAKLRPGDPASVRQAEAARAACLTP